LKYLTKTLCFTRFLETVASVVNGHKRQKMTTRTSNHKTLERKAKLITQKARLGEK
jgi:hypothetical protein